MKQRIFITAMGAISSIGVNPQEHFEAIVNKKSGIGKANFLESVHKNTFPFGEVKMSNSTLCNKLGLEGINYSRTSLLGLWAAKQLVDNSGLKLDRETGFISASTVGGMDKTEQKFDAYKKGENLDLAKQHPLGSSTEFIANQLNIKGYRTTLSTACSSSANAFILGNRLIQSGMLKRVIVGGTDVLSAFTLNGFNSLMILDKEHCKTFDAERKGLNLGEAAAYLLIESEDSMQQAGRKPLAELTGFANTNDAYHQTASSPEGDGAYEAMQRALKKANISITDVQYINAHGTGTANNDLSEGTAIQRVLEDNNIPFSSTKGFTGHTLAAAGALEAVISVLCIQNNFIPANYSPKSKIEQMPELNIYPIIKDKNNIEIKNILSNSFGFGGNNTSLVFSAAK